MWWCWKHWRWSGRHSIDIKEKLSNEQEENDDDEDENWNHRQHYHHICSNTIKIKTFFCFLIVKGKFFLSNSCARKRSGKEKTKHLGLSIFFSYQDFFLCYFFLLLKHECLKKIKNANQLPNQWRRRITKNKEESSRYVYKDGRIIK